MQQANHKTSKFSFSKWYMDCVDVEGNVFIGYSAVLKWKRINLNYANILYCGPDGSIRADTSLKRVPSPLFNQHCLTWTSTRLKVEGTWHSIDPSINKRLLVSDLGTLDWSCFQPKAQTKIHLPNDSVLEGLGYTEQVRMNIEPWKLPIVELRWGRFLSEEDTIVWIYWRGDENIDLLFYQGNAVPNALITDDFISLNDGEFLLKFSDTVVLRKGYLISTSLSAIPAIRDIFPKKILKIYECKWRSRGILIRPNNQISHGWVIHEVVKWNTKTT